jgi:SET domain-containing protein
MPRYRMPDRPTSYYSPKIESRPNHTGKGIFAREPIARGELIAVWGGEVMPRAVFDTLHPYLRSISVQVEEDIFLVPRRIGPGDMVNHSCNPNAGLSGQIALVAMRDIEPGEEICFDYAMTDGSDYDEFECACGQPNCRGRVTGSDWRRPELWERYRGYFAPYLQRRIDRLREEMSDAG